MISLLLRGRRRRSSHFDVPARIYPVAGRSPSAAVGACPAPERPSLVHRRQNRVQVSKAFPLAGNTPVHGYLGPTAVGFSTGT